MIHVATYQKYSGTCFHSLFPGDNFSVGHMAVFVWLLLDIAIPQTGHTHPRDESSPEKCHKHGISRREY